MNSSEQLPEKQGKDVTDWFNAGGTSEELMRIVRNTPRFGAVSVNISRAPELLRREFDEPRWAVPALLPEGLTILAGRPKIRKSWTALDISIAISSGGRAFGSISVEGGDVLYLALEDGPKRLQKRLRARLGGDTVPEGLHFATEWPSLDIGGLEAIEDWLEDHKEARLIVIDTLKRVRPKEHMHSRLYDADYEAIAPLADIARKYSVSILVIHHTRKAESQDPLDLISGSLGLSGAADGVWVLKRARGQAEATLHAIGRDLEEDMEIVLQWDADLNGWLMMGDATEYRRSKERQEVIDLLRRQQQPMKPRAVADALGRKYEAVKKLLWTMQRDGELQSINGSYSINGGNSGNSVTEDSDNGYPVTAVTTDSDSTKQGELPYVEPSHDDAEL